MVAELPCEVPPTPESIAYLRAKKQRMGHTISLEAREFSRHTELAAALAAQQMHFATVAEAIRELKAGPMVVVGDDEDRENEGFR